MATPVVTHRFGVVGSTQDEARRLVRSAGDLPLLVIADRQTRGRGRSGSTWETAPRALACSVAVSPRWGIESWPLIPLLAGLAARESLAEISGVEAGLKWPNDLVTDAGKVGGILVEATADLVVVGVGINLWWPGAPTGFAAVCPDDPGPAMATALGERIAKGLVDRLDGEPSAWDRDGYRAACITLGLEVTWEPAGHGTAVDIAPDGALVVDTGAGRRILRSGEVHTVRTTTLPPGPENAAEGNAQ